MNCTQSQDWLYEADAGAAPPAEIAAHLRSCAECRELAERIRQVEADWRALPAPVACEAAKQRVLDTITGASAAEPRLVEPNKRSPAGEKSSRRWRLTPNWVIVGAVLVAAAVGYHLWMPSSEAQATPDALDRILDINVALTEAEPADRGKLFDEAQAAYNAAIASGNLAPDDLTMAKSLFDNAKWLSKNGDPVAEAERLATVADQLFGRLQTTVRTKKPSQIAKAAKQYADADRAALNSWDDADKSHAADVTIETRLATIIRQNLTRHESFETMMLSAGKQELEAIQKGTDPDAHPHKSHKKPHKKGQRMQTGSATEPRP